MIEILCGTISTIEENSIVLSVAGVGFSLSVPKAHQYIGKKEGLFYTYLHWNPENGPSLYGFGSAEEREVFLLILDCPKIGPKISLSILNQISPSVFLEAVSSQNEKALSGISGIGPKKAEQLITHLKHKVAKLLSSGKLSSAITESVLIDWSGMNAALSSLGYSKPEISKALEHIGVLAQEQKTAPSFDLLLRKALAYLSSQR